MWGLGESRYKSKTQREGKEHSTAVGASPFFAHSDGRWATIALAM